MTWRQVVLGALIIPIKLSITMALIGCMALNYLFREPNADKPEQSDPPARRLRLVD